MTVKNDLDREREKTEKCKKQVNKELKPCLTREQMLLVLEDLLEAIKSEIRSDKLANDMVLFAESGLNSMDDL